jgi:hypothetical protein
MWQMFMTTSISRIVSSRGLRISFNFEKKLDVEYVESLFSDRISQSGFDSFDEWAEKSQTTSLIFIRRDTILYEKYF